jgi:hypothetical protein
MDRRKFLTHLTTHLATTGIAFAAPSAFALDYDNYIALDAEHLAETGLKAQYDKLRPRLRKYIAQPAAVRELINNDEPSYIVVCQGIRYFIYGGNDQDHSWDNATFALFDIVNRQLAKTKVRFFAFYHGNDLGGMFLPPREAETAKKSLPRKADWPYLPVRTAQKT